MFNSDLMRVWIYLSMICASALFSMSVNASCEANIRNVEMLGGSNTSYDVFSNSPVALQLEFSVEVEADCPVDLIISTLNGDKRVIGEQGQELSFYFVSPNATSSNNQLFYKTVSQQNAINFYVRFESGQYSMSGNLSTTLVARVIEKNTQVIITDKKFELEVTVDPKAAVYFSGLAERETYVDLGRLTTNKLITSLPKLRVVSTAPYKLTFESENAGQLIQQKNYPDGQIDYLLAVNKQTLSLISGKKTWDASSMSSQLGDLLDLSMTIGNTDNKPAGQYQDTITISVLPALTLSQ